MHIYPMVACAHVMLRGRVIQRVMGIAEKKDSRHVKGTWGGSGREDPALIKAEMQAYRCADEPVSLQKAYHVGRAQKKAVTPPIFTT